MKVYKDKVKQSMEQVEESHKGSSKCKGKTLVSEDDGNGEDGKDENVLDYSEDDDDELPQDEEENQTGKLSKKIKKQKAA